MAEESSARPALLTAILEAALDAYALLLILAREFIDAQLRAIGEARAAGGVRRERVEVE